jgi:uncharacterized glyoxalase superfamily protein PhnB
MTTGSSDYATLTTVFCVKGADEFMVFCKRAFGAEERMCRRFPNNAVMHADLTLGNTIFWVTESIKDSPTSAAVTYFVTDCDAAYERAIGSGAESVFPPSDTPWGGRWARVADAWDNRWTLATPISRSAAAELTP